MNRKIILFFSLASLFIFSNACSENNTDNYNEKEKLSISKSADKTVYTVNKFFNAADSLRNDTLLVEGIIEHLCRHSEIRFKIIGLDGKGELKVEMSGNLSRPEPTDIGKRIIVNGKPVPNKLDLEGVVNWEQSTINNHVGEEHTDDYKNEIKVIREIKEKLESGQMDYYINYSLEAIGYEFIGQ